MFVQPLGLLSLAMGGAVFIWPEEAKVFFQHNPPEKTPRRLRSTVYIRFLGALWAAVGFFLLLIDVRLSEL